LNTLLHLALRPESDKTSSRQTRPAAGQNLAGNAATEGDATEQDGMKQLLQSLRTGETEIADVPCPAVKPEHLLVRTGWSLISPGTERMLLEFGRANLLQKARLQPERVRALVDKVRTDGLATAMEAVAGRLDQPVAPGYCNVGTVIEVGAGVSQFAVGDRVVSNGPHAQIVCVPKTLCARIPETVPDEQAVLTVLGAVALQGLRLAEPTLGESFAVIGLGLVGLLTVQLLRAQGCRVLGIDFDPGRLKLAARYGAEIVDLSTCADPVSAAEDFSRGRGVDGVCIAAATSSSEPVRHAARMCRKRGRIVLVGVAGLELARSDFYEKELSFRVSCSYGPGRYDREYEQQGHDYPAGFVRWTAQRNFEAVLDLLADRRLDVDELISHRFPMERADQAYDLLAEGSASLGVLLRYPAAESVSTRVLREPTVHCGEPNSSDGERRPFSRRAAVSTAAPRIAFLGCGNFASRVLMPAFARRGARLQVCASAGGVSARHAARKFGFARATTDPNHVLQADDVDAIVIATRHDTHAEFVCRALEAGKAVFVEKPLALTREQLAHVVEEHGRASRRGAVPPVMVGFNRRFAPHTRQMRQLLAAETGPKSFVVTVNAGAIPAEHWTQSAAIGGGRIIGEACHFIDLLRHLCGHRVVSVHATLVDGTGPRARREDEAAFTLKFADGSVGTIHYLASGHRAFPKERVEVFCGGKVLQLDNFRKLRGYGWKGFRRMNLWRQDKGHGAEVAAFADALRQGLSSPVPFDEAAEATRVSFDVVDSGAAGETVFCAVSVDEGATPPVAGPVPRARSA